MDKLQKAIDTLNVGGFTWVIKGDRIYWIDCGHLMSTNGIDLKKRILTNFNKKVLTNKKTCDIIDLSKIRRN